MREKKKICRANRRPTRSRLAPLVLSCCQKEGGNINGKKKRKKEERHFRHFDDLTYYPGCTGFVMSRVEREEKKKGAVRRGRGRAYFEPCSSA